MAVAFVGWYAVGSDACAVEFVFIGRILELNRKINIVWWRLLSHLFALDGYLLFKIFKLRFRIMIDLLFR
jgi:hypothetical protein